MKISDLDSINILGYIFYSDDSLKQLSTGRNVALLIFFLIPDRQANKSLHLLLIVTCLEECKQNISILKSVLILQRNEPTIYYI